MDNNDPDLKPIQPNTVEPEVQNVPVPPDGRPVVSVSPDLVVPDMTKKPPRFGKKKIIIASAVVAVCLLGAGGWWLFGDGPLTSSEYSNSAQDEYGDLGFAEAAFSEEEESEDSAASSGDDTSQSSSGQGGSSSSGTAAVSGGGAGSTAAANKIAGSNKGNKSLYYVPCTVNSTAKKIMTNRMMHQVERAVRVSYNGDLKDHLGWVPKKLQKKIQSSFNKTSEVEKAFKQIKPNSCKVFAALSADTEGNLVSAMVKYKSSRNGSSYENVIVVAADGDVALTVDVSKPVKTQ